jgi:hypothetical protein
MNINKMIRKFIILALLPGIFLFSPGAYAALMAMGDSELDTVQAQAGLSIMVKDITFTMSMDSFKYVDTDTGNAFELKNVLFNGGPTSLPNVTNIYGMTYSPSAMWFDSGDQAMTWDVMTIGSGPIAGKTLFVGAAPTWDEKIYMQASNVVFAGQDLGSLNIDDITVNDPNSGQHLMIGGHNGIDFEMGFDRKIGNIRYIYNTTPESLEFQGVHLTKTAAGDPTNPSTWTFSGQFTIGNELGGNPASFDIETITTPTNPFYGKTVLDLGLPMQGSIRIDNVAFGGTDFGPIAIDGIVVHRLHVYLVPGS